MNREPSEGRSLLTPIATRYKPSPADFERVSAKIEASLAAGSKSTASAPRPRLMKWLGLSCIALLVGGVAARELRERPAGLKAPPAVVAHPVAPHEPQQAEVASAAPLAAVPVVSVDTLPVVPRARAPVRSGRPSASPKSSAADDTLAREARLLAGAESAFRRGANEDALSFLDEHARLFPSGLLKDERIAERIIVLCHSGRHHQAIREGETFLRDRPSDPLRRRVAQSCAGSTLPPNPPETP